VDGLRPTLLRHELTLALATAALLVLARSFVFVAFTQAEFDADQAIMGLMAKHISEGRAFPVFVYGFDYILVVEAWLAAPIFLVLGPSVTALKLPLLAVNLAAALLLVRLVASETGIRPLLALVAALFVVFPPPSTSAELLSVLGGNPEPFLYVLLLWIVRNRPLVFGLILGVGFLNREFTIYAATALIALQFRDGTLFRRVVLLRWLVAFVVVAVVWDVVRGLQVRADFLGPGTAGLHAGDRGTNLGVAAGFACVSPIATATNLWLMATRQLPSLFGAVRQNLPARGINSTLTEGFDLLWPLLAAALVLAAWRLWRARGPATLPPFCAYLMLVGLQAIVVCALTRCGPVELPHMRYMLLALFFPVGLVGAYLGSESNQLPRRAVVAVVLLWASANAWSHTRLVHEYAFHEPAASYRAVADYLVSRGIPYARGDYWTAYHVTFLANERAIVASDDIVRVEEYQRLVDGHASSAVSISRRRCAGGVPVGGLYVCSQ
jgi:hypothetical protein